MSPADPRFFTPAITASDHGYDHRVFNRGGTGPARNAMSVRMSKHSADDLNGIL
jgi:hypothetical protein